MEIFFVNKKLADIFSSEKKLVRNYGPEDARTIMRRMQLLNASVTLNDVPPTPPSRRHALTGDKAGQFAVDLKHPFRLVFEPHHNPLPHKADGGLDLTRITAIKIIAVEDYH
jgi:proteic killer suppression protein